MFNFIVKCRDISVIKPVKHLLYHTENSIAWTACKFQGFIPSLQQMTLEFSSVFQGIFFICVFLAMVELKISFSHCY